MNIQRNKFTVERARFSNNRFATEEDYSCIELEENFKSIKDDIYFFTNFAKSQGAGIYKFLLETIKSILITNNLDNENSEVDEIEYRDDIFRLQYLIYINSNIKLDENNYNQFYKVKNKNNPNLQFYFYREDDVIKLVLVDIYHLALTGKLNGKDVYMMTYNKYKNCNCDISNALRDAKLSLHL